ncbi:hypothetical protein NE237_020684 [Protea cynaroides]|uniref:Transmembrane protein n=1 Tax=Protea cynaroides TaxID=273540 RepID=A0A9Q0HBP7_9MAGN|nr:hypothetical protein NE237_020684 [Protea cynaroides]
MRVSSLALFFRSNTMRSMATERFMIEFASLTDFCKVDDDDDVVYFENHFNFVTSCICVFVALPNQSWLWLISVFNTVQVIMTTIKYIPQVSVFFDVLFMFQHYVLYPSNKNVDFSNVDLESTAPLVKSSNPSEAETA